MRASGALLLLLGVVSGCTPPVLYRPVEGGVQYVAGPPTAVPQRYADAWLTAAQAVAAPPLELSPGSGWRVRYGAIHQQKGLPHVPQYFLPVDIEAARYTTVTLRIRAAEGHTCHFAWRTDLDENFSPARSLRQTLTPDGAWREYRFTLRSLYQARWTGRIQELCMIPSDLPGAVELGSVRFSYTPPSAAPEVFSGGVTMAAFFGSPPPWRLSVPDTGRFEARLGVLDAESGGASARFCLDLTDKTGQRHSLLTTAAPAPGEWRLAQADLSPWGGQKVILEMRLDHGAEKTGDYCFWGAPSICSAAPEQRGQAPVILISCDTLAARHCSCYGYERKTTPFLERFAEDAVLFEQAVCQETWTLPSHMSLLTGCYPKRHQVDFAATLPQSIETLPQRLRTRGYRCAGFTGYRYWLDPSYGFSRGFDLYDTPRSVTRSILETLPLVEDWVARSGGQPFMLFFHNFDIHHRIEEDLNTPPYQAADPALAVFSKQTPNPLPFRKAGKPISACQALLLASSGQRPFSEAEQAYVVACYDDAIRAVDATLEGFISHLKGKGIYEKALIIITSDHGEEFGEKGHYLHQTVYEGSAHVPLLIKFPDGRFAGKRIADVVELIDLAPTIAEVAGIPTEGYDGQSLLALLEARRPPAEAAYIQRDYAQSVRSAAWKLIRFTDTGDKACYHLAEDPCEAHNLAGAQPEACSGLHDKLNAFYQPALSGWRFRWIRCASEAPVRLRFEAPSQIRTAHFKNPAFPYWRRCSKRFEQGLRRVEQDLNTWPQEALQIAPMPASAPCRLHLSSTTPFEVYLGETRRDAAQEHSLLLEADKGSWPEVAPGSIAPDKAGVLAIWWEPPENQAGAGAKPLSAEDQQTLEALGYLE